MGQTAAPELICREYRSGSRWLSVCTERTCMIVDPLRLQRILSENARLLVRVVRKLAVQPADVSE
jgi:hypothetical protein